MAETELSWWHHGCWPWRVSCWGLRDMSSVVLYSCLHVHLWKAGPDFFQFYLSVSSHLLPPTTCTVYDNVYDSCMETRFWDHGKYNKGKRSCPEVSEIYLPKWKIPFKLILAKNLEAMNGCWEKKKKLEGNELLFDPECLLFLLVTKLL